MKKSSIDIAELLLKIERNSFAERFSMFIWGVLLYAISFSLFFSPNEIVTGGSTGLSLIINELFHIDMSLFVLVFSIVTLIVGYIYLGKNYTIKTISGVLMLPVFMKFTSIFPYFIDLTDISLFLIVFIGGLIMGLGNGIIIRSGFSVGGFQTIYQMSYKYLGLSIGKSTLITNGTLVIISGVFFGWSNALYAIIGLYIASVVTDKVMLETSVSKTFFIVTKKPKEINDYIIDILGHGATLMNAKGGYKEDNKKILMCVVPTRQYYQAKEVIQDIDEDAFFLITDTYEIYGGM